MFKKKKCKKCGKKLGGNYEFCPYCGKSQNQEKEFFNDKDWGMLGKNDFLESDPFKTEIRLPFGFNTLFNSLVKNLDVQLKEIDKQLGKEINQKKTPEKNFKKSGRISISISSFGNQPPKIKVNSFGNNQEFKKQEQEIQKQVKSKTKKNLSEENLKKLSKLPKEEPSTNIRRLSDKVVYEINLPGVKSINDVSIIELENSIEIKALSKDKAYFKLIPINLPILKEKFTKEKLTLELDNS